MRAIIIIVVVVRQLEGEGIALVDGGNGAVIDFISYDGPSEWCGIAVGRIIVLLSVESGRNRPRTVWMAFFRSFSCCRLVGTGRP